MSQQALDQFNSIGLVALRRLEEKGDLDVKPSIKRYLLELDSKQKKEVLEILNRLMAKPVTFDSDRVAGIISGIAIWAFILDDFAMTASFDNTFRNGLHRRLVKITKMEKEEFFDLFDKWDEMVGGFQNFRSKMMSNN